MNLLAGGRGDAREGAAEKGAHTWPLQGGGGGEGCQFLYQIYCFFGNNFHHPGAWTLPEEMFF